jgi:hypothetical protein
MRAAALSNSLILLVLIVAGTLASIDPDLHYRIGQEDGFLEWATFWAFVLAACRYFLNARRDRRESGGIPWFAVGLGLFCILVALEEISWGQRLFGYRPPDYFLHENFQQEFNLHNVASKSLRKLVLLVILAGYGVGTALISLIPAVNRWFRRWRIVPAPPALVPSFFAMSVVYAWYPWDYTGEWVELAMGLGFMCAAFLGKPAFAAAENTRRIAVATLATTVLAAATVLAQDHLRTTDMRALEMAQVEVEALAQDFASLRVRTRCGLHKRLYTFVRDYEQGRLLDGEFARRLREAGETQRADYLLDPWNSPYWLRHKCRDGRVAVFVYSFGPNRQRDSNDWEIRGDDVGARLTSSR